MVELPKQLDQARDVGFVCRYGEREAQVVADVQSS